MLNSTNKNLKTHKKRSSSTESYSSSLLQHKLKPLFYLVSYLKKILQAIQIYEVY